MSSETNQVAVEPTGQVSAETPTNDTTLTAEKVATDWKESLSDELRADKSLENIITLFILRVMKILQISKIKPTKNSCPISTPKLNPSNETIVWLVSKLVLIKKLPNPNPCISPKATVRNMSNLSLLVQ